MTALLVIGLLCIGIALWPRNVRRSFGLPPGQIGNPADRGAAPYPPGPQRGTTSQEDA